MYQDLLPANVSCLADYIEKVFIQYQDAPAYSALGQTFSFNDIETRSNALARWFQHEAGLKPGDRIAIQLPNLLQNPIAVYAALRAGLVVVNTNPLYTPREMAHQFSDSGAKAIVILSDLQANLDQIIADTPIQTVLITSLTEMLDPSTAPHHDNRISMSAAIQAGQNLPAFEREPATLDTMCMLQYTGGTTGVSKGAALSNGNILSNSVQTLDRLGDHFQSGKEIVVCPLPLYHIYAFTVCMMTFFAKGCLTVLIPNPRDPDAFIGALKPFKFTTFAGINTLFVGLGQHPVFKQLDFSALKLTLSGGTALTSAAVDIWKSATGCNITEGYGLSETSPVVTFNQPGSERVGTIGVPLLDTDVQILDQHDQPVADGEEGQIAVKGPQVMLGYWQREEATAEVMTADGYFKTGDIGVRLDDGAIKIVDRLKDMVIVSGFNVYPNEIEEVLTSHPDIVEAAVVGAPDDKSGERVCAYVSVAQPIDKDAVLSYCREQLTGYKVPKELHVLDEIPKSTVGKILRRELRK